MLNLCGRKGWGSLGGLTSKIGGLISDEYTGMLWEYIYDELEKRGIPSSPDKNDQEQESGQQEGQNGNPEDGQDGSQSGRKAVRMVISKVMVSRTNKVVRTGISKTVLSRVLKEVSKETMEMQGISQKCRVVKYPIS